MAAPVTPSDLPERTGRTDLAGGARRLIDRARALVLERPHVVIGWGLVALVVSMAAMFLLHRAGLGHRAGIDYQVYRWAVRTWLDGGDLTAGAPMTSADRLLPWVYPPFALVALAVPALLPFTAGLWLLYLADLAAIAVALHLVTRRVWPVAGKRGALAVALAGLPGALLLEPVYASFGLGQINIVLMGLVAADCLTERPRWPRGLLVGLAAAIKLTPAAFLLFFLVRRDYRAAVVAGATALAGTASGFLINLEASVDYWFGRGPAAGVSGSPFHTNQSVLGGLARLDLPPLTEGVLWVALSGSLVLVTIAVLRRTHVAAAVLANALLALLVSPTSWSDHWVWVAPGLLLVLATAARRRSAGWSVSAAVIVVVALAASFRMMPADGHWNAVQHLIGDSYLVLGIAMLLLLARHATEAAAPRRHATKSSEPAPSR